MSVVRRYLERYHSLLLHKFRLSEESGTHGGDMGENREQLIVDLINAHQPRRLLAQRGGQVIGLTDQPSKQIDVLVTHDSTIEFREHGKSYRIAEAVVAAIAVKSDLTNERLQQDISNLSSLPSLSHDVLQMSHLQHAGLFDIYTKTFPIRMVVGWNGATADTLLDSVQQMTIKNPELPIRDYPDVVTVLERGFALQIIGKREALAGKMSKTAIRWELVRDEDGPAWPLIWLLNQLSSASGWSAMFTVNLEPYWK